MAYWENGGGGLRRIPWLSAMQRRAVDLNERISINTRAKYCVHRTRTWFSAGNHDIVLAFTRSTKPAFAASCSALEGGALGAVVARWNANALEIRKGMRDERTKELKYNNDMAADNAKVGFARMNL